MVDKTALPVVPVNVTNPNLPQDTGIFTYALLDHGSTRTFCTARVADMLKLEGPTVTTAVDTLFAENFEHAKEVTLMIKGATVKRGPHIILSRVLVLRALPESMSQTVASIDDVSRWTHLRDLVALHEPSEPRVELLIGQDSPASLMPLEVRSGRAGEPFAVRTKLGWSINGPLGPPGSTAITFGTYVEEVRDNIADTNLEEQVKRFWVIDMPAEGDNEKGKSVEDQQVINLWSTHGRKDDRHFQFPIPFRHTDLHLPNNWCMASKRLASLKCRLRRDEALRRRYSDEMRVLLDEGYAEPVEQREGPEGRIWYLPHHPVFNPNKPDKTRIVFDCAAQYQGISLNSEVSQGPPLMNEMLGILLRFRQGAIAVAADIEKMFYQIKVCPADRDVLRFLWWPQGDLTRAPRPYRMTVHPFGGIWSPSCASFTLQRVLDCGPQPAAQLARRNFYVDDLLLSVDTEEEAVTISQTLMRLLWEGGFRLTKWTSNSTDVLQSIPENERNPTIQNVNLDFDNLPVERALGVLWELALDTLSVKVNVPSKQHTRRGLLSVMSSVYDPIGILAPFTIRAKMLFQDEVRRRKGWDHPLTAANHSSWARWLSELDELGGLHIDRCYMPRRFGTPSKIELHHFCDASQSAYAVVTYLRFTNANGQRHCAFVCSRARLAPLKATSIPRLELCAAVMAVKTDVKVRNELSFTIDRTLFWSDSMIVLQFITSKTRRFHTFVANRVGTIHQTSEPCQWRHVKSESNPADDATRGLTARELLSDNRWIKGATFLWEEDASWPAQPRLAEAPDSSPEVRREVSLVMSQRAPCDGIDNLLQRYSSWFALRRAVAWLQMFCRWIGDKKVLSQDPCRITIHRLRGAEKCILRLIQDREFKLEKSCLLKGSLVPRSSKLYRLEPAIGDDGLLRVGGRTVTSPSPGAPPGPVILPRTHPVTKLIVREVHDLEARHSGREHTLACLRRRYWVAAGRQLIDPLLRNCITCRRVNARPAQQRQGDLPTERITPGQPPFRATGVDCFGPFTVTQGRKPFKRYGCIFTCLSSRAVHLEMLHSLDADAFLNAVTRFIARRGAPEKILSDNGTNMVRADKDLRAAHRSWGASSLVDTELQRKGIEWTFLPPSASHMGGVWERMIRSVRKILHSIIGTQRVDDERLTTLFCEVEATLNSRPITAVSPDCNDLEPLTPNHLLRACATEQPSLGGVLPDVSYQRRWKHAQSLADRFWRRWSREYLHSLRMRQRRLVRSPNPSVGDLVLLVEDNLPRNRWRLGRIAAVFPGSDGLVRKLRVRTAHGTFLRPVTKVCLLEDRGAGAATSP